MKYFNVVLFLGLATLAQGQLSETDEIISQMGYKLDSTLNVGSLDYIDEIYPMDNLFKKVIRDDDGDEKIKDFNAGFTSSLNSPFGRKIIELIQNGGSYDFVNYFEYDRGDYGILFRFYMDGAINYHEYYLTKNKDNEFFVDDVYIYITGEFFSETLRNLYNAALGNDETAFEDILKLKEVKTLMAEQKLEEAKAIFKTIHGDLKNNKVVKLLELQLVSDDNDEYLRVMEEYARLFPKDASLFLVTIDKFFLDENYGKVLEMVDSLYSYTNDDFLDLYRGSCYLMEENEEKTLFHFERLISNYPNYAEGYDVLLNIYEGKKEYEKSVNLLDSLIDVFQITKKDLAPTIKETYPNLYQSDVYKRWIAE